MPVHRTLLDLHDRIGGADHMRPAEELSLPMPSRWAGDRVLWARVVSQARLYSRCQARQFNDEAPETVVEHLFDDLSITADMMRRGGSIAVISEWVCDPIVRKHDDAARVRKLIALLNYLEIF